MPAWIGSVAACAWQPLDMQVNTVDDEALGWQAVHEVQTPLCAPLKIGNTASCWAKLPRLPVGWHCRHADETQLYAAPRPVCSALVRACAWQLVHVKAVKSLAVG